MSIMYFQFQSHFLILLFYILSLVYISCLLLSAPVLHLSLLHFMCLLCLPCTVCYYILWFGPPDVSSENKYKLIYNMMTEIALNAL